PAFNIPKLEMKKEPFDLLVKLCSSNVFVLIEINFTDKSTENCSSRHYCKTASDDEDKEKEEEQDFEQEYEQKQQKVKMDENKKEQETLSEKIEKCESQQSSSQLMQSSSAHNRHCTFTIAHKLEKEVCTRNYFCGVYNGLGVEDMSDEEKVKKNIDVSHFFTDLLEQYRQLLFESTH
ncbi:MAG: hypothetical protein EZS28_012683, partial [Streblomastix strix]